VLSKQTVLCFVLQVVGGAMNNEIIHLWPCAMLAAGFMLVFKCMSADQARDSVEWSIFVSTAALSSCLVVQDAVLPAYAAHNMFLHASAAGFSPHTQR
jgi:hypothetical protein